jgi:hypothetical protein
MNSADAGALRMPFRSATAVMVILSLMVIGPA